MKKALVTGITGQDGAYHVLNNMTAAFREFFHGEVL